ncbi:hypothetical protein NtRootA9_25630 [Arthrobacter sp. NtRootA9]|nr:hypothetical protein NtRootA9_25630 [Arthrobacter sp. NtRootA9]
MTGPEPSRAGQPAQPLDYWLSRELAAVAPPQAPTRLRQLADAQAARAAAWSSAIAGGPVLALCGVLVTAVAGNSAPVLVLGMVGAALAVLGVVRWKRVRSALPDTDKLLIVRGPGSARGGALAVVVLGAVPGAAFIPAMLSATATGTGTAGILLGAYLLFLALLVACLAVPAAVLGRGRRSFRRRVLADTGLRQAVEQDLASWRDPYGNAAYGPL